ncbi:MAG: ABC transporter permease [Acidimicrobiales bacterium]
MLKVTLRGLMAHKRRLVSTFLGVLFGIAFLAGTLMLSDTIGRTFDELFADVYRNVDAVARSDNEIEGEFGADDLRGRIDASLVDVVKGVDGVDLAEGSVVGYGQLIGTDGEPIGDPNQGAPTFAVDWPELDELNPFNLAEGRAPEADDEVVIDKHSADEGDLAVGDRTTVITKSGPIPVEIVGMARFGDADSPGGASFAMFTQAAAERYVAEPGKVDEIAAKADGGVSEEELRGRLDAALPDGVEVLTGQEITEEAQNDIQQALSFFTIFLTVFAGIAMVVSVFSIYNTFSIIVAQRTREMALLRAVGASRPQVLASVLGESLLVGLLASVLGLVGGIGMVQVLKALLSRFGVVLPSGGLVLKPNTVVVSLVVGLLVTLLSAAAPAIRASRVPPLAALRDVALDRTAGSRIRLALGVAILLLGMLTTFNSATGGGEDALFTAAGGVLLVLIGALVLGPVVARPVGRALGAPLVRLRGVTGRLARENVARNPKRTANTAAALLIGVGVVGFFTVLSASLKNSISAAIDRTVTGDFVIHTGGFGGVAGLSPQLTEQLNGLPEVEVATGLRYAVAAIEGDTGFLTAVDPDTFTPLINLDVYRGALGDLGPDGIAVSRVEAEREDIGLGDTLQARFPQTGERRFEVRALYERDDLTDKYVISTDAYDANVPDRFETQIFVEVNDGVAPAAARRSIEAAAAPYPTAEVQDQQEFKDEQADQVNQILGLVYAMLAFAVTIALMGIANTLSLSIHERARELGLLRAVGMTRSQLRASVRWESVIIAVFGTLGGIAIAVFFGWIAIAAADEEFLEFTLPAGSLIAIVALAAMAGVGAALRPASRAARLDPLRAIAVE